MFFFVYPALNPFKYPPLWVWKKVYPRNLQNKRYATPTETHPCKKSWVLMGQEKLPLEGLRMEWGGICSFSHHESREFLIHVNSISCQESPKKHQNLYNVLEEKKNNQSLFLGKVWKRGHAPPHLWPKPSQKSKKCSQKLIEYYIFSNLDPKVSCMYAYNFARQSWVKPAYSRG